MTSASPSAHPTAHRMDWPIPLALLLVSAIPVAAGIARLLGLASGATGLNSDNARFFLAPVPVVLHIFAVSLYSVLGALQFSTGLRQRYPQWHRVCGRIVVASGVLTAVTGIWMTTVLPIPAALQGALLYNVRLLVSATMLVSIAMAVSAIRLRDIAGHRAWMIRAYAMAQGAGMQVVIFLPWMLLMGDPVGRQRDALMSLAWLINLLIAEWFIHRQHLKNFNLTPVRP